MTSSKGAVNRNRKKIAVTSEDYFRNIEKRKLNFSMFRMFSRFALFCETGVAILTPVSNSLSDHHISSEQEEQE
jgi:hypothetical protein